MKCLADFVLASDLCLEHGVPPLTIQGRDASVSLTISNIPEGSPNGVLAAQLLFDAESLDNIREVAQETLAPILNMLAYATNRKFGLLKLNRVIDWTPGVIDRRAVIYVETPEWDSAEPELNGEFTKTVERLLQMQSAGEQDAALRWYRLGIQATHVEEQFSYFWFALEIVAEATKDAVKVASKCPRCQGDLLCEACGDHPLHRKYAGEAIRHVIRQVHPQGADEVSRTLERIRHTLMHGARIDAIIDQLPCNQFEAVNKLAYVTWHAIALMFDNPDPRPDEPLQLGYVDNLVRQTIVGGAVMVVRLPGDPNAPALRDFPDVKFDILRAPAGPLQRDTP
jgi:hypothetical protein